jgi:plasmid maintenance system antidote protein VapI
VNQLGFPSIVTVQEIARKTTLGGAITLCAEAAGLEPKEIQAKLKTDKAQWSRWESGTEGIVWPKFAALMDLCGNDAPLLWMNCQRGYDLASIRRKETETERLLRESQEALHDERLKNRVLIEALHGRSA